MPAGTYIKAARIAAGLTQRELAERLGVTQPAISALESGREDATVSRVEQALAAMHLRFIAVPSWAMTAADAAVAVAEMTRMPQDRFWASNRLRPIIQLSDDLHRVSDVEAVLLMAVPAPLTGDEGIDALIAGVCELHATRRGAPVPDWIHEPARFCAEPWDLEPLPELQGAARAATPDSLARHNVYVDPSFLASV